MTTAPTRDSYPRQTARTRRFTLGEPRGFRLSRDGTRVVFLRSAGGSDARNSLWVAERRDDASWHERLVCDPATIAPLDGVEVPPAERARRERMREQGDGITAFDLDESHNKAVFSIGGQIVVVDVASGNTAVLASVPAAFDPRIAPDASLVAYVADACLHVVAADGSADDRVFAADADPHVSWGQADFNAAEEFGRMRGFWWSPDSRTILAARVDENPVPVWWIADPAHPDRAPRAHRYPAAGTQNAIVSLSLFDVLTGSRSDVDGGSEAFPYLVEVRWSRKGLLAVWLNRVQDTLRVVSIDPSTGHSEVVRDLGGRPWAELTPGTPVLLDGAELLTVADLGLDGDVPAVARVGLGDGQGTRALVRVPAAGGAPVPITPPGLQVRRVVAVGADHAILTVVGDDPAHQRVVSVSLATGAVVAMSDTVGVHDATAEPATNTSVIRSACLDRLRAEHSIVRGGVTEHIVANLAEVALVDPAPVFFRTALRRIPVCVLLPSSGGPFATASLPVVMDPYGGPHAQRVVASRNAHASSQWLADQGFAVVVVDGRGTPGVGPRWEYAVHHDLAGPVLDDQVEGLHEAAERFPELDLTRVAIRGWSFGGYLAALAVLKRPDVFHAAIAGAPVTDWRLYDTGYTERYLGNPNDPDPERAAESTRAYDRSGLRDLAPSLSRPLQIIHGLADDNVVVAHSLLLSGALLAAGRPHEVLPLSGVTHMTSQEVVAENLLLLQVDFLRRSLRH